MLTTGSVAGDALMCLGIEDAMWMLQGGGMARFGHAVAGGQVQARGAVAMLAALAQACRRDTSNSGRRPRPTQARAKTGSGSHTKSMFMIGVARKMIF